jgi:hypothetical protein
MGNCYRACLLSEVKGLHFTYWKMIFNEKCFYGFLIKKLMIKIDIVGEIVEVF